MAVEEERLEAAARNSAGREKRAEEQVRLIKARGLAELGRVASGSAMQDLWLRDRKVETDEAHREAEM